MVHTELRNGSDPLAINNSVYISGPATTSLEAWKTLSLDTQNVIMSMRKELRKLHFEREREKEKAKNQTLIN